MNRQKLGQLYSWSFPVVFSTSFPLSCCILGALFTCNLICILVLCIYIYKYSLTYVDTRIHTHIHNICVRIFMYVCISNIYVYIHKHIYILSRSAPPRKVSLYFSPNAIQCGAAFYLLYPHTPSLFSFPAQNISSFSTAHYTYNSSPAIATSILSHHLFACLVFLVFLYYLWVIDNKIALTAIVYYMIRSKST